MINTIDREQVRQPVRPAPDIAGEFFGEGNLGLAVHQQEGKFDITNLPAATATLIRSLIAIKLDQVIEALTIAGKPTGYFPQHEV